MIKRSSDGGITYSQPINLSNTTNSDSINPQLAAIGNDKLFVVWQGNTNGQFDVFLSKSSDGGITFSQPINLSNDPSDSINPNLIVVHNNLFVIWNDNITKNYNVMIKRSSDGGITFSQPINCLLYTSPSPRDRS